MGPEDGIWYIASIDRFIIPQRLGAEIDDKSTCHLAVIIWQLSVLSPWPLDTGEYIQKPPVGFPRDSDDAER